MQKDTIRGGRPDQEKLDKWITQILHDGSDDKLSVSTSTFSPLKKKPQVSTHVTRAKSKKMRIIPLGGLEEVGKNAMVFEYADDIVVVDMGFQFPEEDMLGIDYVVPDVTYLEGRQGNIRGIIITHGHMDHIGGLPYVLPRLGFPPVYATKLTMGLIKKQLEEFDILKKADLREIKSDSVVKLGYFEAKFFRVNHSIPDGVGVYLKSPVGAIVHTGDFKFDPHPADDKPAEVNKMKFFGSRYGDEKVVALFSDSTNALKPGRTVSERVIGESLDRVIASTKGRIIIASFASLIGRIQQVLTSAQKHGRVVAISGRSMEVNIRIACELGYLKIPKGVVKPLKEVLKMQDDKVLILTTGSQGEAMSALTRMSLKDHKQVQIKKGDTVIISAHPIIGNEQAVATVINNLCKLGANIVSNDIMDVHTSGHGNQDDLEQMIRFIRPLNLVPIHGNLYMRTAHAKVGRKVGLKDESIFLFDSNGDVLEIENGKLRPTKEKVPSNYIVVDGLGTGDIGSQVLLDREIMAQNGIVVVICRVDKKSKELLEKPFITTRGFVYFNESEKVVAKMKDEAEKAYKQILHKDPKAKQWDVCNYVKRVLDGVSHRMLERRPLIVVLAMKS